MGDGEADKAVGKGEGEGEDVGNQEGGDGEEVGGVGSEEVGDLVGRWREGREGVEVEVGVDGREVEVCLVSLFLLLLFALVVYLYTGFGINVPYRSIYPRRLGSISISALFPLPTRLRLSALRARKRRRCIKPSYEVSLRGHGRMIWSIFLYVSIVFS